MQVMKTILILMVAMGLAGCRARQMPDQDYHVVMLRHGPGKVVLEITRHTPQMVGGEEGYKIQKRVTYKAALAGNGPTFENPHFADNPPEYHCVGTISLDLEHDMVRIEMRRIVSKPGEPEETEPHPANGMYQIEKIKKAGATDWWF